MSIGEAVREIIVLMFQCYSMSLGAISPSQRGSTEGVKLFCVLIGRLSRIVDEDDFSENFNLIVISSSVEVEVHLAHLLKGTIFRN